MSTTGQTTGTANWTRGLSPEQAVVSALVREQAGSLDVPLGPLLARADPVALTTLLLRARVFPPLAARLLDAPDADPPVWLTDRAEQARTVARHRGLFQQALLLQATAVLAGRDIPVAPLKGTTMAESLYGDLGARESADLDLLVEPDRLDEAVDALTSLGWAENRLAAPERGLPVLHRVLEHPDKPPIEVHWRVHWYEESFAGLALRRAAVTEQGWLRLAPPDELATLLLFLARDGLAGLRQVVDVAAWWRALGRPQTTGLDTRRLADRHPALEPSLTVAARWAESWAGLQPGSLMARRGRLTAPQRLALRLANPWLAGEGQQVDAEVSLIDGLLAPRGQAAAFARRRLAPPARETIMRRPTLASASAPKLLAARVGHGARVAARYLLAVPTVLTGHRRVARQR